MAFLHSHSSECLKSELDLFSLPQTQTSIEASNWITYSPISSLNDESPIEFCIQNQGEEYLDLAHTLLKVSVKIPTTKTDADKLVAPVNNFLHSLFNQIDIYFNQKPISAPNNTYPYRAYIESLLNYGPAAKQSHLTTALWYSDTAGEMDSLPGTGKNQGLKTRQHFILGGKTVDLLGHLHCDIFNQDKLLINGVEMKLRLVRSKDSFCLMDASGTGNFKVKITEAALLIRRVKISPGILIAHAKMLSTTTAKYPLTRVEIKTFTLHSGILGETLDNIILGQLPKRIILGFVDNKAFNGDRTLNPFNFQNYGINYLSLYVDGVQVPSKPLQPSFSANSNMYIDSYHTLYTGTGIHFLNEGNDIDRLDYPNGYCLFAFDLTPDFSANSFSHWNLVKSGNIRVEVRFQTALSKTINCLVYAEFDNVLEIDSARQIVTDFHS